MHSEVFNDFLAGCIGGVAGVLAGYPLDTVKVRLQTQNPQSALYRGTFHCIRCILKSEGPTALYKGMSSPLASLALVNALIFGMHGQVASRFKDQQALSTHFFAGAAAGAAQAFISSPMELLKLRAQLHRPEQAGPAPTPCQMLQQIVREKRFRHLSRGLLATQLRDCPAMGVYFASFEFLGRQMSSTGTVQGLTSSKLLLAGGAAGMLSWLANYPADVIKTRFQADDSHASYSTVIRNAWAEGGWRTFYIGLGSTLLRAFPTNAATFFAVEWTYRLLLLHRATTSDPETAAAAAAILLCHCGDDHRLLLPEAGCTLLEPMLVS